MMLKDDVIVGRIAHGIMGTTDDGLIYWKGKLIIGGIIQQMTLTAWGMTAQKMDEINGSFHDYCFCGKLTRYANGKPDKFHVHKIER